MNTQTACKCGQPPRQSGRYCHTCHAAYMRQWRQSHPLTQPQRTKANARSYAKVYLRRGKLSRQPCEICGNPSTQMHHDDYSKPLAVRWLCPTHHHDLHNKT